MNAVEISGLYFKYDDSDRDIISGINISIARGEIISVLGLSGCGKSTFCYCISGIIPHIYQGCLRGQVLVFGEPVSGKSLPSISKYVGIIFQDCDTQLFSPTVEDEIAFGPENLCLARTEIGMRIDQSLEITGMQKYRYAHPQNLSGGEKQLIAIASVLALDPEIIIFDESTAYLDYESKERIKDTIKTLKEKGKTIITVEHDTRNLDISDRVFFMHEGRLEEIDGHFKGDILELYKS
ncbi:MAG: ABC transporter ATP-binding protein [Actinobacteria bacterium]|nr:ABC transporter ATP-binding protein [Actinomycetota bacterium]